MTNPDITDAPADTSPSAALAPAEGSPQPPSAGAPDAPHGFAQSSDRIDAISAALAKAQGQMANPTKGAVNPHFKSQYADLSAGLNAVRAALSANSIAIVQTTRMESEVLMLDTMLAHASGQWIASQWPVVKLPAAPQVIGSALTYARRYTLFALVGIAGEGEDDDGNAASGKDADNSALIDRDQLVQVQSLLDDTKSKQELFFKAIGCTGFSDMTVKQWKDGMARLREKQRGAAKAAAP